jgi:hypothetical protein
MPIYSEEDLPAATTKFVEFMEAHPELKQAAAMWMADGSTLEMTDPEAAAILAKEFPELKG